MVWFCKLENKEKVDEVAVGGESPSAMTFRHSNWDKWCGTREYFWVILYCMIPWFMVKEVQTMS